MFEFQQVQTHDLSKDKAPSQRSNDKAPAAHGVDLPTEILGQLTRSETPLVEQLAHLQTEDPEMFREVLRSLALTQGNAFVNRVIERLNPAQAQAAPNSERTRLARRSFHAASSQDTRGLFDSIFGPAEKTQQKPSLAQVIEETPSKSLPMREQLEQRFAEDLGHIQVHTGPQVSTFLKDHGAQGAAIGQHILLKDDAAPHTIAEEVAHSKQQGSITAEDLAKVDDSAISQPGDVSEREAGGVADQFVAGQPLDAVRERRAPHLARQLEGEQVKSTSTSGDADTEKALREQAIKGSAEDVVQWVSHWNAKGTTPSATSDEYVQLIWHLLSTSTGDAEEQAGLKILAWASEGRQLNQVLQELHAQDHLKQIFDDYHGEEYESLLSLIADQGKQLSIQIQSLIIKGFLSDCVLYEQEKDLIIQWLRENDKRVVDTLYEVQDNKERVEFVSLNVLIEDGEMLDELRSALDDKEHFRDVELEVAKYLTKKAFSQMEEIMVLNASQAYAAVEAGVCQPQEAERLLAMARADYVNGIAFGINEWIAYQADNKRPLSDIIKKFENYCKDLEQIKRKEFEMELKHKVQINAYDPSAEEYFVNWDLDQLNSLDKILSVVPPELIEGVSYLGIFTTKAQKDSPEFKTGEYIDVDQQGNRHVIIVSNAMSIHVVHELGHHFAVKHPDFYNQFILTTGWKRLSEDDLTFLLNNKNLDAIKIMIPQGNPSEMIRYLDTKEQVWISKTNYGYFSYLKDYGGFYFNEKYETKKKEYAKENPDEDFAQCFYAFLCDAQRFRALAPQKFSIFLGSFPHYEDVCASVK